ncbi:phage tail family protein [Lachnospiraceae bacterium CLA-AA-H215]|uniref:Phage tail family protein n=1 Tax=Hominifimenecus microfluidus TaxID=2885348 RepID=A0AAE3JEI5_9FIRM|nr:phage tail domain-containing protein [Hominifimenecus microfluidus]MCC2231114.1 phage tail family protein [Hominifimenecus microfluidus]
MACKIQFFFQCGEDVLTIGDNQYGIVDYSDLESPEYDYDTEKRLSGYGSTIRSRRISEREITITAEYKSRREGKEEAREFVTRFFRPYTSGNLTVRRGTLERNIDYEISEFRSKNTNIYDRFRFQLTLLCPDPALLSEKRTGDITTWVNGLRFPFKLPFSLRRHGDTYTIIENKGDLETPVLIRFYGPALNPVIQNVSTGEHVKVRCSLKDGEILEINTDYGAKSVILRRGGESENLNQVLDLSSRFFWLQLGENVMSYKSDNTAQKNKVTVSYHERYLGI